ncbi:hypothetical protein ACFVXG_27985 [Kitasatospora sp. NPDC058162]|uniref:hypothetical protein n=1 Tax=Kitasatospora sp. NPDC058162 TaxID=3346362 RepID=UPI0036D75D70
MNNPDVEALSLHEHATALEQQRDLLPAAGFPVQVSDPVALSRQITQLGSFITALGTEFTTRITDQSAPDHALGAAGAYAEAIGHLGQAACDLGEAAEQLTYLRRTDDKRHDPKARELRHNARQVIGFASEGARGELQQAARTLRQAASVIAPDDNRVQAARSRSATAVATGPAPNPATPPTPPPLTPARPSSGNHL